jgi:hypothetical protein
MKLIKEAICHVFPNANAQALTMETKLSDIEDWDSMNAINLVVKLEELSGCHNLSLMFGSETTIGLIAEGLRSRGVQV